MSVEKTVSVVYPGSHKNSNTEITIIRFGNFFVRWRLTVSCTPETRYNLRITVSCENMPKQFAGVCKIIPFLEYYSHMSRAFPSYEWCTLDARDLTLPVNINVLSLLDTAHELKVNVKINMQHAFVSQPNKPVPCVANRLPLRWLSLIEIEPAAVDESRFTIVSSDGVRFFIHAEIVCYESEFFDSFFKGEWKKQHSELKISFEAADLRILFEYLYTGFIEPDVLRAQVFDLYVLADYLQIRSLQEYCQQQLCQMLFAEAMELELLLHTLEFALMYNIVVVKQLILEALYHNWRALRLSEGEYHKLKAVVDRSRERSARGNASDAKANDASHTVLDELLQLAMANNSAAVQEVATTNNS